MVEKVAAAGVVLSAMRRTRAYERRWEKEEEEEDIESRPNDGAE